MISDEELVAIADDFEELGSLRAREALDPYHDDDIAWITRSYSHAFRLLSAYRELKAENEEIMSASIVVQCESLAHEHECNHEDCDEELERLKAENERLRSDNLHLTVNASYKPVDFAERDRLKAENERLQRENIGLQSFADPILEMMDEEEQS